MELAPVTRICRWLTKVLKRFNVFTYLNKFIALQQEKGSVAAKLLLTRTKCAELEALNKALESGVAERDNEIRLLYRQFFHKVEEVAVQRAEIARLREELAIETKQNGKVTPGIPENAGEAEEDGELREEVHRLRATMHHLETALEAREKALAKSKKENRKLRNDHDQCLRRLLNIHDSICGGNDLCSIAIDKASARSGDRGANCTAADIIMRDTEEMLLTVDAMSRSVKVIAERLSQNRASLFDIAENVRALSKYQYVTGTEVGLVLDRILSILQCGRPNNSLLVTDSADNCSGVDSMQICARK